MAKQTGGDKDQPDSISKDSSKSSLAPKTEEITRSVSPKHEPAERRSSGQATLGLGNPTPCKRAIDPATAMTVDTVDLEIFILTNFCMINFRVEKFS